MAFYSPTTASGPWVIHRPLLKLVYAYALFTPWLMFPVGGTTYVGFSDLMVLSAIYYVLSRPPRMLPDVAYFYLLYLFFGAVSAVALVYLGDLHSFAPLAQVVRAYLIFFPFMAVFYLREFDAEMLRRALRLAIIGSTIAAVAGIVMFILGIEVREEAKRLWLGNGRGAAMRAAGLNGNSGSYGMLLALWGTLVLFVAPAVGVRLSLVFRVAVFCGVAYGLVISSSRGGMVQFGGAAMLYYFLIVARNPVRAFIWAVGCVAVAVVAASGMITVTGVPPMIERSLQRLDVFNLTGSSDFLTTVRLQSWSTLPSMVGEVFWWGVGFKQFELRFGFFLDNAYMLSFFESGIFALVAFLLFWGVIVISAVNALLGGSYAARLLLIITLPFMARMFTGGANTNWAIAPVVFLLMGAFYRLMLEERRETGRRR